VIDRKGACNQRKEGFVILLDQFGNTPFPLFILVRSPAGNKPAGNKPAGNKPAGNKKAYPVATGNLLGKP